MRSLIRRWPALKQTTKFTASAEHDREPVPAPLSTTEDFLTDCQLTVAGLADAIGMSRQSINELLRGRRAVSPEMALRLARLFGNTPEFWLNAQRAVDLWDAGRSIGRTVAKITPLQVA